MFLLFALMYLSRSEMAFIYVISTNLVDIKISSMQRDRRVFYNSKLHKKMKGNKFYLFHYGFKAPLVFYVSFFHSFDYTLSRNVHIEE